MIVHHTAPCYDAGTSQNRQETHTMRFVLGLLIAMSAVAFVTGHAAAASEHGDVSVAPSYQQNEVDDNDDTRVEVQLVVLGIVIATVFVFGSCVYLLRKRLGLVAPPPEPGVNGHL
jgi:drug/metabolite transporter (DMT)-like permease